MKIERPPYVSVPLATGLAWSGGGGFRYEEKHDGVWAQLEIGSSIVVGEKLKTGDFYAFDIPVYNGQSIAKKPLFERLEILDTFNLKRPATGNGGEFLEAVLARGGEGVVAKQIESQFGWAWVKCKRIETHDLVVTAKHVSKSSIELGAAGWCGVGSLPTFGRIQIGDVVEVACYSRTASGKLREPRFVRLRPDKSPTSVV